MSTLVTYAPSCSPGTLTSSVGNAPAGTVFGWRLMCACAVAGRITAAAASNDAIFLLLMVCDSSSWALATAQPGSSDRDLHRSAELFEFGDAVGDRDLPSAARTQHGRAEDVVAGAGHVGPERQRPDCLRR